MELCLSTCSPFWLFPSFPLRARHWLILQLHFQSSLSLSPTTPRTVSQSTPLLAPPFLAVIFSLFQFFSWFLGFLCNKFLWACSLTDIPQFSSISHKLQTTLPAWNERTAWRGKGAGLVDMGSLTKWLQPKFWAAVCLPDSADTGLKRVDIQSLQPFHKMGRFNDDKEKEGNLAHYKPIMATC